MGAEGSFWGWGGDAGSIGLLVFGLRGRGGDHSIVAWARGVVAQGAGQPSLGGARLAAGDTVTTMGSALSRRVGQRQGSWRGGGRTVVRCRPGGKGKHSTTVVFGPGFGTG